MKRAFILLLIALLALPCAAEGDNAFTNGEAGYSFAVPEGFERRSEMYERMLRREANARKEDIGRLYALNVWKRGGEDDEESITLEVQVKEPNYATFEEEITASERYEEEMKKEIASQLEGDPFGDELDRMEVYDSGTLCETPAGRALRRSLSYFMKDGGGEYMVTIDLYAEGAEYGFTIHASHALRDEADALMEAIVPTISVFPADLKLEEIPVPGLTAGGWQEPLPTDPEVLYDVYMDATDGSEQLIFGMIDYMNDEEETIADGHALAMTHAAMDDRGQPADIVKIYLQDSEFGKVIISVPADYPDISMYSFAGSSWQLRSGLLYEMDADPGFDTYFASFRFPYGQLETLNALRQDENGFAYMLVRSDEPMSFEFVMKDGMEIVSLRVYDNDGGRLVLAMTVDYAVEDAQPLPQVLVDTLREKVQ